MEQEKLCQNINATLDRLTFANSSLNIVRSIQAAYKKEGKELFIRDINFWKTVTDDCCFRALVELAKTYEEGKDSVGLQKILNQTEQLLPNEQIKQLLEQAREKYATLEPLRDKLRILRDKGLVHSDKKYASDLNTLVTEYGLPLDELNILIDTAAEICSDILGELTGTGRTIELALSDDASEIIKDIKFAQMKQKEEHKAIRRYCKAVLENAAEHKDK